MNRICPKWKTCTAHLCTHRNIHEEIKPEKGKVGCDAVPGYCPECVGGNNE